jgi:hypothetical protein
MRPSTHRTLNRWIVLGAILLLMLAFVVIERYIRQRIEGPGHLRQGTWLVQEEAARLYSA